MKKRCWLCLLVILLLLPVFPVTVRADMGPKPSVNLEFEGLEEEEYYVTLITQELSNGPWSINCEYEEWSGEKEIWDKFKSFKDESGYFFLGYFEKSSETDSFAWTYYPPDDFKILIYFPEYDRFVLSRETYMAYAFDSYFKVNVSDLDIKSVEADTSNRAEAEEDMEVTEEYEYKWELLSLLCRIVGTILIELLIAWLFMYKSKKQILIIGVTNAATQTLLNVLLNIINYKAGGFAFILGYIGLELLVFVIEGVVFASLLNKYEGEKKRGMIRPWLYALTANVVSFFVGMEIAKWIPGIF